MVELIKKAVSDHDHISWLYHWETVSKLEINSSMLIHGQFNTLQIMTCILAFLPSSTCDSLKMMVTLLQLKLKLPIKLYAALYLRNRLCLKTLANKGWCAINAKFANYQQGTLKFHARRVFCSKVSQLTTRPYISPSTLNELEEEFIDYQLMLSSDESMSWKFIWNTWWYMEVGS